MSTPNSSATKSRADQLRIASTSLTIIYVISAVALLVWGAMIRFKLPQQPIIDPDIEGYLGPAIMALGGKGFHHLIGRSFQYPLFIFLLLRAFGDFRAIAVAQHILGVAAGGLVLLAWNAIRDLAPNAGVPKPLWRFMGLLPAYLFLGSSTAIMFEHWIRPEGIFSFLAILNIWLTLRFMEARFVRLRPAHVWLGAAVGFVSILLYMTKPSFGLETLLASLPIWISLIVRGASARQKQIMTAAAILPALLLLMVPEHFMKKSDVFAKLFLPETVLSSHAVIIEQQLTEDAASNGPLPYPHDEIVAARDMLGAEIAKAPTIIQAEEETLTSYKPDYLLLEYIMYGDSFCAKFPQQQHLTFDQFAHFCMTYYLRALRHHPVEMAQQAWGQLILFYAPKSPVYRLGRAMNLSTTQYVRVAKLMAEVDALAPGNPTVARYIAASTKLAGENIEIRQGGKFDDWLRWFSGNYLQLLSIALASPLLLISRPMRAHFAWLVAAIWLAYSYNFGNSLTIAVVHSMEVNRYVRIQLIFTIFSQCLSLGLLVELAWYLGRAVLLKSQKSKAAN
jgi:hypothetical protein